jgi:hypothetical protein
MIILGLAINIIFSDKISKKSSGGLKISEKNKQNPSKNASFLNKKKMFLKSKKRNFKI